MTTHLSFLAPNSSTRTPQNTQCERIPIGNSRTETMVWATGIPYSVRYPSCFHHTRLIGPLSGGRLSCCIRD